MRPPGPAPQDFPPPRNDAPSPASLFFFLATLGTGLLFLPAQRPPAAPATATAADAPTDVQLYEAIIEGTRSGVGYYDVTARELRARAYPSRSVFNWRLPTYAWLMASLPGPLAGRALLVALALWTFFLACGDLLRDLGLRAACVGGLLIAGALGWAAGEKLYLFTECWAGALIALSLALTHAGRARAAVAAGLASLLFRELALPYVVACAAVSAWEGKRREALAWALAALGFAALLAGHAHAVLSRLGPLDQAMPGGWVRFGGMPFLLTIARHNLAVALFPPAFTALFLATALLGFLAGRPIGGPRAGVTAALYLLAFSIVGAPFNHYWGLITAPLLAFGCAAGLPVLARAVARPCRAFHAGASRSAPALATVAPRGLP